MRILVEAYGCTLNRGEAGEFTNGFLGMGHDLAGNEDDADAFVIFTCDVIETTERHMLKRVREFARSPEKPLLVCGCLPNICPERILKVAPHAALFGPATQSQALKRLCGDSPRIRGLPCAAVGMLPIATGCIGSCAYCITKTARGGLRSRAPDELAERLATMVNSGAAEVQICAQDTAAYGLDIGIGLDSLIQRLEAIDGDFMMRIGMMNPANVKVSLEGIVRAFESPKVFKFLHLPVQSGSDAVLERMGRRHTAGDFRKIVATFREKFPGMALSTDIIIGFPGEAEEDFRASMELMREVKPDIINITRFSSRPGTEAHNMTPKVPGWKAKDRSREMTKLRFEITSGNYAGMKGKAVKAMATERRKPGTTFLRTVDYRPVVASGELELGEWHCVKVTGKARTHLSGKVLGPSGAESGD